MIFSKRTQGPYDSLLNLKIEEHQIPLVLKACSYFLSKNNRPALLSFQISSNQRFVPGPNKGAVIWQNIFLDSWTIFV